MWGLLLLFFAAVYFAVVGTLLFKVKPIGGKVLVLIAAILIPNADDWYYRNKLANYCKTEAGFKIYQQVSRKEGLVFSTGLHTDSPLKDIPVPFVEWPEKMGGQVVGYWRSDRLSEGNVSKPYKTSQYTALYENKDRIERRNDPFNEVRQQVVNRRTGELVGEFGTMFYYGGWYPGALVGTGSLVGGCGKSGQVLSHREWGQSVEAMKDYDGSFSSNVELINRVFFKE
jgi:hypothetical protein